MDKPQGTSILFVNSQRDVLLFLRDDISEIPFPNMWDLPGGTVEPGETPEQTIIREMKEEIDLDLEEFSLFSVTEFSDRIEYTFWKEIDLDIEKLILTEGQLVKWFSEDEIKKTELAFGFNGVVENFYKERPFKI
jgi:8-oxo-dGTP diphosphatase